MYVRKKHNRSGTTSVVVVSKASGKYKEIKSFGSSSSEEDIESLCNKAAAWIRSFGGQQELDFDDRRGKEVEDTKRLLNNIDNILINGTQLLLGQVYDSLVVRHRTLVCLHVPRHSLNARYSSGVWIIHIEVGMCSSVLPVFRHSRSPSAMKGIHAVVDIVATCLQRVRRTIGITAHDKHTDSVASLKSIIRGTGFRHAADAYRQLLRRLRWHNRIAAAFIL